MKHKIYEEMTIPWHTDFRNRASSCPIDRTVISRYHSRRRTSKIVSSLDRIPNDDLPSGGHRECLDPPPSSGCSSDTEMSHSTATTADGSSLTETITTIASWWINSRNDPRCPLSPAGSMAWPLLGWTVVDKRDKHITVLELWILTWYTIRILRLDY